MESVLFSVLIRFKYDYVCFLAGVAPSGLLRVMTFVASAGGLPANETTIAELLKDVGYRTALIGNYG